MSYSSFVISDLSISTSSINEDGTVGISALVTNTGTVSSKYSVLLFLYDVYRTVTPEYKVLKRFTKVELGPSQSTTVSWTIAASDLQYIGVDAE